MKSNVVGQTGRCILSDTAIQYKPDKKRTLRYRYERIGTCYMAVIVGPLKHRCYGVCGIVPYIEHRDPANRNRLALAKLSMVLANDYGYHDSLTYSSKDEADAR